MAQSTDNDNTESLQSVTNAEDLTLVNKPAGGYNTIHSRTLSRSFAEIVDDFDRDTCLPIKIENWKN